MKTNLVRILLFFIFVLSSTLMFAGKKEPKMEPYRKETVKKIEGRVINEVIQFNKVMQEEGLHLIFQTEDEEKEYLIHVCPAWVAEQQNITFKRGEKLTITGSEFLKKGKLNLYAAEIIREGKKLQLRNPENGEPLWKQRNK